ncbi:MAG: hypothetical protein F6K41_25305 [Symploca sp. SIO3E6]|nr:hypothetical protein [Caldora sp. SIO3E6]
MRSIYTQILVTIIGVMIAVTACISPAQAEALIVSRVYSDDNQITHFADQALEWEPSYSRVELTGSVQAITEFLPAKNIGFFLIPGGSHFDWHPAPRKQFVMVLTGKMEVQTADGEVRVFEPGTILLDEDIDGIGHVTNVIGNEDVLIAWVPIP